MHNQEQGQETTHVQSKLINLPSVGFNIEIYFHYWLSLAFAILFGFIFKILFGFNESLRFVMGFNFLLNKMFYISLIISHLFMAWVLYIFFTNRTLRSHFERSIIKYLNKLRCGFFLSNWILILCYYIINSRLFIPLKMSYGISLSQDVLKFIFSGAILNNTSYLCETFLSNKINIELMTYITYMITFLLKHNIYCLFWISWADQSISNQVISLLISCFYVAIVHLCSLDNLLLFLLSKSQSNRKSSNILFHSQG